MKHTFILIEKIVDLLNSVPSHKTDPVRAIETEDKRKLAWENCEEVVKCAQTLRILIKNHRKPKYLKRLHDANISKISDWAKQLAALFEKLDRFLYTLEKDIKRVQYAIINDPKQWEIAVHDMAWGMYLSGLINDEEELKKFRKIAIFEMHELHRMISPRHLAEIDAVLELLK